MKAVMARENLFPVSTVKKPLIWRNIVGGGLMQYVTIANSLDTLLKCAKVKSKVLKVVYKYK